MKNPVALLIVTAPRAHLDALAAAAQDVRAAGRVAGIELRAADVADPAHDVVL